MSSRDKRKWIHKSYFNILERIGYTTKSSSCDDAISQLTFFSIFCILLPVFVGSLANIPSINSQLLQWVSIVVSIGVSFDMIKEMISKEIKALEKQFPKHEEVSALNEQISKLKIKNKNLEESGDCKVREEQLLINLVRLYEVAPNDLILEIIMNDPALHKRWKIFNDTNVLLSDIKEKCTHWESRKNLGAIIRTIKKDSWKGLATSAALHALGPNLNDTNKLAHDKPEYLLFQDIYIYLYAWLVNSIDNSMTIDILYMPIEDIGLRYRSKQSPDIDKYKKAFEFLVNAFDTGDFYIGVESIQSLSQEQIEICKKGVPLYLNKLIEMLNDFEPRSRESLSIEEQP
jgi:hypothetical protein